MVREKPSPRLQVPGAVASLMAEAVQGSQRKGLMFQVKRCTRGLVMVARKYHRKPRQRRRRWSESRAGTVLVLPSAQLGMQTRKCSRPLALAGLPPPYEL